MIIQVPRTVYDEWVEAGTSAVDLQRWDRMVRAYVSARMRHHHESGEIIVNDEPMADRTYYDGKYTEIFIMKPSAAESADRICEELDV